MKKVKTFVYVHGYKIHRVHDWIA